MLIAIISLESPDDKKMKCSFKYCCLLFIIDFQTIVIPGTVTSTSTNERNHP